MDDNFIELIKRNMTLPETEDEYLQRKRRELNTSFYMGTSIALAAILFLVYIIVINW